MLAWLTPNQADLQEDMVTRLTRVPYPLLSFLSGALWPLTQAGNWEAHGDMSPEETADYFHSVFEEWAGSNGMIGQIAAFVRQVAKPVGWLVMAGQTLSGDDYPQLFNVLPTSWKSGSDFTLPNMAYSTVVGSGTHPTHGTIAAGATGGAKDHTLTVQQMPTHSHTAIISGVTAPLQAGAGVAVATLVSGPTDTAGGGREHNNMQPYLGAVWCIYAGKD